MKHTVITTRTQDGGEAFAARLKAQGINAFAMPLLCVQPTNIQAPQEAAACQGIIATSGQIFGFIEASDRPLYAVGEATAAKARAAGFTDIHVCGGDVAALGRTLQEKAAAGPLLYPCAEEPARGSLETLQSTGIKIVPWPVYRTVESTPDLKMFLACCKLSDRVDITLHSPRAAAVFSKRVLPAIAPEIFRKMNLLCLSQAVLESLAVQPFGHTYTAKTPDEDALFELICFLN